MNGHQNGWRGRDAAMVLGCVFFAFLTLAAVGESGRRRAKEIACQSNLRQWHNIFQGYIEENDGVFLSGCNDMGYWWPLQLSQELQDWKKNRTWFCPSAAKPIMDESGVLSPATMTQAAYGIFTSPGTITYRDTVYSMNRNGIAGSFGLNGYVLALPENRMFEGSVPASQGWRNLYEVADPNRVPMFVDALRFDLWPHYVDSPAPSEFAAWSGNHMARCCINRHDGAVNCLFVDGAVRKVGLKELWTLKWHRSFNTAGPWTAAGGVQPEDWPQWIRGFKDY